MNYRLPRNIRALYVGNLFIWDDTQAYRLINHLNKLKEALGAGTSISLLIENPLIMFRSTCILIASRLLHHLMMISNRNTSTARYIINTCIPCCKVYGLQVAMLVKLDRELSTNNSESLKKIIDKINKIINYFILVSDELYRSITRDGNEDIGGEIGYPYLSDLIPECSINYAASYRVARYVSEVINYLNDPVRLRKSCSLDEGRAGMYLFRGGFITARVILPSPVGYDKIITEYIVNSHKLLREVIRNNTIAIEKSSRNIERLKNIIEKFKGNSQILVKKENDYPKYQTINDDLLRKSKSCIDELISILEKGELDSESIIHIKED